MPPAIVANSFSSSTLDKDDFDQSLSSLQRKFFNQDYAQVASGTYIALMVAPDNANPFTSNGLLYYRALSLQALGRSDDALRELQALTAKRSSAWATLAELHLPPAR